MSEKKITATIILENIKTIAVDTNEVTAQDIIDYCDKVIGQIAAKAEKTKLRNAEKRAAGDELKAAVQSVVTNELQTREQIFEQIEGEDLTVAKVGARLTQLVADGAIVKEEIKIEGQKGKKMAYRLA